MFKDFLDIDPKVEKALEEGVPVIALESAMMSHDMPCPQSAETILKAEEVIKEEGAMPATVGIIRGRIRIGLTKEEIRHMAAAEDIQKVSRCDFPAVISKQASGATTVAGTMIAANMAGIRFLVTDGIGGAEQRAGGGVVISADLEELKITDVTVICGGVKAVSDAGATLQYLRTSGVPAVMYGAGQFPDFCGGFGKISAECRLDTTEEIAELIRTKDRMGLKGGILVACPAPEVWEIPEISKSGPDILFYNARICARIAADL